MTPADIARSLRDRLEALLDELLPGGRRAGWEWRCGSVSGEEGQSLAVHLAGQKRGV